MKLLDVGNALIAITDIDWGFVFTCAYNHIHRHQIFCLIQSIIFSMVLIIGSRNSCVYQGTEENPPLIVLYFFVAFISLFLYWLARQTN